MPDKNVVNIRDMCMKPIPAKEIIGVCGNAVDIALSIAMSYALTRKRVVIYNIDNNRVLTMCARHHSLDKFNLRIVDMYGPREESEVALVFGSKYTDAVLYNMCAAVLVIYDINTPDDLFIFEKFIKTLHTDITICYKCPYTSSFYKYCIEERLSGYVQNANAVKFFDQTEDDAFLVYQLKNFGEYDFRKFSSVYVSNIIGLCGTLSSTCSTDDVHNSIVEEFFG